MKRRALLLSALAAPALAQGPNARDRADVARVEAYLNGLRTLKARFLQLSVLFKLVKDEIPDEGRNDQMMRCRIRLKRISVRRNPSPPKIRKSRSLWASASPLA